MGCCRINSTFNNVNEAKIFLQHPTQYKILIKMFSRFLSQEDIQKIKSSTTSTHVGGSTSEIKLIKTSIKESKTMESIRKVGNQISSMIISGKYPIGETTKLTDLLQKRAMDIKKAKKSAFKKTSKSKSKSKSK